MLNAIGRELPEHADAYGRVTSFARALAAADHETIRPTREEGTSEGRSRELCLAQ